MDRNVGQDLKNHILSTLFLLILGSQTPVNKIPGNIWGCVQNGFKVVEVLKWEVGNFNTCLWRQGEEDPFAPDALPLN